MTALPAGGTVDGSVRRIERNYDNQGRLTAVTSYDTPAGGTAVNSIAYEYDAWGAVSVSGQDHDGAGPSAAGTVRYAYARSAGGALHLDTVTYPDGRIVRYGYGSAGGADDGLSRVGSISSSDGAEVYAEYAYLGVGAVVQVDHPAVDGGLTLSYGTAADDYAGWDPLGRVVDMRWESGGAVLDRFTYAYDGASNRTSRVHYAGADDALGGPQEFYIYDGLNRLTAVERTAMPGDADSDGDVDGDDLSMVYNNYSYSGMTWADGDFDGDGTVGDVDVATLDAHYGTSGLAREGTQDWTLDSLGNWREFTDDGVTQTREFDAANQLTGISGEGGADWVDPAYDDAGNMIFGPAPGNGTAGRHYVYDAWNRLAAVRSDNNGLAGAVIVEYRYDGLGRRIARLAPDGSNWDRTDYYYDESGQVLEERSGEAQPKETVPTATRAQYVWDIRYVDAPVVRFYDGNLDGDVTGGAAEGDSRLYYTTDANWNVTALVDGASGAVVERYVYDPYGAVSIFTGTRDGQGNSTTEWQPRSVTLFDNQILYAGYRRDPATGLYHTDTREYDAYLGRWLGRDGGGYIDGMNLYQYVSGNPATLVDPSGLCGGTAFDPWNTYGAAGPIGESGVAGPAGAVSPSYADMMTGDAPSRSGTALDLWGYDGVWPFDSVYAGDPGDYSDLDVPYEEWDPDAVDFGLDVPVNAPAVNRSLMQSLWEPLGAAYWYVRENAPKLVGSSLQGGDGGYSGYKIGGSVEGGAIFGFGAEGGLRVYGVRDSNEVAATLYFETTEGASTGFVTAGGVLGGFLGSNMHSTAQAGGPYVGGEANCGASILAKVGMGGYYTQSSSGSFEVGANVSAGPGGGVLPPFGYIKGAMITGGEFTLGPLSHISVPHWVVDPFSLIDPYVPRHAK